MNETRCSESDTVPERGARRGFLGVAAAAVGGTLLASGARLFEGQAATPSAGADPIGGSPEQFKAFIDKEFKKWQKVVQESGATAQ